MRRLYAAICGWHARWHCGPATWRDVPRVYVVAEACKRWDIRTISYSTESLAEALDSD